MDASLLTKSPFWNDPQPSGSGAIPDLPELAGHVLFETSGSSGSPKSVALSKRSLLTSAAAVNQHLGVTSGSHWGLALPLNHVGGFGVAARAYQADCGFDSFNPRWEPIEFQKWLTDSQISHTSLVPTQVHDLVEARLKAPATLLAIVVGGGCLDSQTGQAARDLGWPVLASYGMTEAASQIATQGLDCLDHPYHSSPISLLSIWDAQTTADQVLSISGPALFSGYVIQGVFHPRNTRDFSTADRAHLQDRMLTPLGRVDTLVKILGELVDPESIEKELVEISNGEIPFGSFAIAAVPDERAGFLLVPFFGSSVTQELIDKTLASYQSNAAGFKRLKQAVILKDLPRSELGKILKNNLVRSYLAKAPKNG